MMLEKRTRVKFDSSDGRRYEGYISDYEGERYVVQIAADEWGDTETSDRIGTTEVVSYVTPV